MADLAVLDRFGVGEPDPRPHNQQLGTSFLRASMIAVALLGEPICSTLLAFVLFNENSLRQ